MATTKAARKQNVRAIENFLAQTPEIEASYNREKELPFFYHCQIPTGTISWVCALGPDGEIMSVYKFKPDKLGAAPENKEMQLKSLEDAISVRDRHVADGWQPTDIPTIKANHAESLNRKQRRAIAKLVASGKNIRPADGKDKKGGKEDAEGADDGKPQWKYSDEEDESE
jgi:hypothetical protein